MLLNASCARVDLSTRPVWSLLPVCLYVLPEHPQLRGQVQLAVDTWNRRLEWHALGIAPACEPTDTAVVLSFVRATPDGCGYYGCVRWLTYERRLVMREVWIALDASYATVLHELGHLVGCRNGDLGAPCWP